jgi:hypothetical protein
MVGVEAQFQSVILSVSDARDLGEYDRFQLYDHMKAYTAAPPDVLRVDEKNVGFREASVPKDALTVGRVGEPEGGEGMAAVTGTSRGGRRRVPLWP